jgi:molybdenum cofactor biosynthesis enzyme MoaA
MDEHVETLKKMLQEFTERSETIRADASATYAACEGNPKDVQGVEAMDAEAARYKRWADAIRALLAEREDYVKQARDLEDEFRRETIKKIELDRAWRCI